MGPVRPVAGLGLEHQRVPGSHSLPTWEAQGALRGRLQAEGGQQAAARVGPLSRRRRGWWRPRGLRLPVRKEPCPGRPVGCTVAAAAPTVP